MPRHSATERETRAISPISAIARLRPPPGLTAPQRAAFVDLVAGCPANHFRPSDLPLLRRYVEAAALAVEAATALAREGAVVTDDSGRRKVSPWLRVHDSATKNLCLLATRLRVSPQARTPNNAKRPPTISAYERMSLVDGHDDMEIDHDAAGGTAD